MEKIIVQKLHEIEEKEHGKILLAGQWILESEIAGLREKAGKLGEEKKVSWEKLNEIFLKEIFGRRWCIREDYSPCGSPFGPLLKQRYPPWCLRLYRHLFHTFIAECT